MRQTDFQFSTTDADASISGELLAIMGPSGSGKTTLLNLLARRDQASGADVEGQLMLDDKSVSITQFRAVTSFVEQDDEDHTFSLFEGLTTSNVVEVVTSCPAIQSGTGPERAGSPLEWPFIVALFVVVVIVK